MSGWQLIVAAVLYAWVARDYADNDRWALSVAFICYAVANLAFAVDAIRAK